MFQFDTVCGVGRWLRSSLLWKHTETNSCKKCARGDIRRQEEINSRSSENHKYFYWDYLQIIIVVSFIFLNKFAARRRHLMDIGSN